MPKRSWSFSACRLEAAKYKKRSQFARAAGGAYNKALKEGWIDEICAHMDEVRNVQYSFQQVADEAKKYSYRSEFKEKACGYYQRALRQKWLDQVCSHMRARTDGRLHCVYAIVNERENKAYVGITRQNLYKRIRDHKSLRSKANAKLIIHLQDTKIQQLTDYIYTGEQVVRFAEQKFIDIYRHNGWEILNSQKAVGRLGYSETIWTYEKLLEEASKYESRKEFSEGSTYRSPVTVQSIDNVKTRLSQHQESSALMIDTCFRIAASLPRTRALRVSFGSCLKKPSCAWSGWQPTATMPEKVCRLNSKVGDSRMIKNTINI